MEPECSLLCSQKPATNPYLNSGESGPHLSSLLILSSMLSSTEWPLVLQVFRLFMKFDTNIVSQESPTVNFQFDGYT